MIIENTGSFNKNSGNIVGDNSMNRSVTIIFLPIVCEKYLIMDVK
jgi:hypothetical protein